MQFRYSAIVPDVGDIHNATGRRPGYRFEIAEEDGGIMIQMLDTGEVDYSENDVTTDASYKGIFMGYGDAEEVIAGLRAAIHLARAKGADPHSSGIREKSVG